MTLTNFNKENAMIQDHLKDIDFRAREERQRVAVSEFIDWYRTLVAEQEFSYSERTQGQLTMISSVLWYLLPKNEYKRLVTSKHGPTKS